MTAAITTNGLTKHYGDVHALNDLDLEVDEGEVFGFLGPNGAGKTTTIRSLLNYITPTAGTATVLGLDAQTDSVELRRHVSYQPAEYSMYENLTGGQYLQYFANLRGGVDRAYVHELADRLGADLSKKIADYSTGNKQKIGLIQAFMNKPRLLILDEPSTGLDPLVQQELQQLYREVQDDGRTVFLSSHTLGEVERVADRVAILRQGHLVVVERVDDLKRKAIRRLDIEFENPVDEAIFESVDGVRSVTVRGAHASVSFDGPVGALLRVIVDHHVLNINSREADLEEIFLAYYRGDEDRERRGDDGDGSTIELDIHAE
ncbi:MAG: ABC transporter ATP-binding protein [Acidimicrobiia bacterium]|nr:ABC transporter ATP-binding protein [Acidimicrobiia bacterium]